MISQRSAFDFRSLARALAAGLPRQDHVNRIVSVYGLSRTVVPHLLQANCRLTPLRAHHKQLLVAPTRQGFHYYSLIMIVKKRGCGRTTPNASTCCNLRRSSTNWSVRGILVKRLLKVFSSRSYVRPWFVTF